MLHKIMVFGLLVVSLTVLAASDAGAIWINGKWVSKGVECQGEAIVKNIDKNKVTIACNAEIIPPDPSQPQEPNVILVCQNPGGNISIGRAFINYQIFDTALYVPFEADKKGKTIFSAILKSGVLAPQSSSCDLGDIYCNCENDQLCRLLRDNCPNNNWVPVDVVPLRMMGTVADYFCDNDGQHNCPCDLNISDPSNPYACASATGNTQTPWIFSNGVPIPLCR